MSARLALGAALCAGVLAFFAGRGVPPAAPAAPEGAVAAATSPVAVGGAGIEVGRASRHAIAGALELLGSVTYDAEFYAVVGPQATGRIVALRAQEGSEVKAGAVLAVMESPQAGEARGEYVAARARAAAAEANRRREEDLAQKRISSGRELELARAQAQQEEAAVRVAGQRLRTLGLEADEADAAAGGRISLVSPLAGTVVERRVALGESVAHGDDAFVLADLAHLWVMLDVYEKDLERVHVGQPVELRTDALPGKVFAARVSYVEMHLDADTRTAQVRISIDNKEHLLRPGQFVSARIQSGDPSDVPAITVPKAAIQTVDSRPIVFVKEGNKFAARDVKLGRADETQIEVVEGVQEGEEVVVRGAFFLKSQLLR
ncbi:MAG TPA: efflux RND transporter periplasmic adaptor subunit [Myxococcota bacterium]|nr:efflux RND transporter periplasmic adaptor subunit [Myxococcota bacterium]